MTKETQTQAIAEPFKFKNAALLNRLSEMAQVPYYATACHTLIQAEMAIVELERENATLRAEVERLAAQSAPFKREDLTLAAVNCEHQIDADCVRLHRDPTQEGSALSQLVDRVVAVIEQSTAQPQAVVPADQRPVNCGTGYCSCIECVVEPTAQAERAPVVQAVQAREYPPLPWGNQQPYVWFCRTKDTDLVAAFRAYVDADRASSGATTQAVRMLTEDEQAAIIDMHSTGRAQGDHECAEAIQRKFCEVNKLRIPADGVIGGA